MQRQAVFDILGIGTAAVDDLLHVDHYPPADRKCPVVKKSRQLGGLVATALAAAARLGARCAYAGLLGEDELSAAAREGFEAMRVDCRHLATRAGAGPIHSVIIVDDSTQTRNIFFDLAPVQPLSEGAVTRDLIASAKVLFIDQLGMVAKIAAARHARELKVPVVADMEWPEMARTDELMALVGHMIVSQHFASEVAGEQDPVRAAEKLHAQARRACTAVTCGDQGCYYLTGDALNRVRHQPAFPVKCVETTGCGDVFHGAYAAALAAGHDVATCVRQASAAAAVYASRPSGWEHLPTAGDVARLLE